MRGRLEPDGTIIVRGSSSERKFSVICGGVGWPEGDPGYFLVVGLREDGRYHCLWEKQGRLWELGEAIREGQSAFLLDCVWADAADKLGMAYLRNLNTVTIERDGAGPELKSVLEKVEPAVVVAVRENVTAHFGCALEKIREIMMRGGLLVHEANCPNLIHSLRRPWRDLLQSPVIRALVYVISGLESGKGASNAGRFTEPWYGNISRSTF
jgi:hypothetical protein